MGQKEKRLIGISMVLPRGTHFIVDYKTWRARKVSPIHWQGEREASILDGRFGIVLIKVETPDWYDIYRCLIGSHDIELGRAWLRIYERTGLL